MINLNQNPYYENYDETKDFHQVLFKPGLPVQASELTQSQTILQKQISRFGDHVFNNGSRVTGAKLSVNQDVYSVAITATSLPGITAGNYIRGVTSGLSAEIVEVMEDIDGKSFLIYIPRGTGLNGAKFSSAESLIAYVDGSLVDLVSASLTTDANVEFDIIVSGMTGANKLTVSALSSIRVGTYLATIDSYVIAIDTTNLKITLDKTLTEDFLTSVITAMNSCSTPTALIGVTDGVFYTNGKFARVGHQQIVPDVYNRWITRFIGLVTADSIVTSEEDQTLLDPSQGSYNYMAPGADRLKVSLILTSYKDTDTKDITFIELFRFEDGVRIRQNDNSDYGTLMKTLAERTYDESGNYVVTPFLVRLKDLGEPTTITAAISPGKAYVGGYEFETIASTPLLLDRALEFESTNSFGINTYVGNYLIVTDLVGAIPVAGTTVQFALVDNTVVGTAILMQVAPNLVGTKLYVTDVNGNIATATKIIAGTLTATIATSIIDSTNNCLVYSAPQTFVKTIDNISYTAPRTYRNVPFTNGVATISALNVNDRFVGGTGILPSLVADANYQVHNVPGYVMTTVDVKPAVSGVFSQVEVSIDSTTYDGFGDVVVMVEINADVGRVKTINQHGALITSMTTTYQSLKRADFHELKYVSNLADGDIYAGKWTAIAHPINTVVYSDSVLWRALATTTTTAIPSVSNTDWELLADISDTVTIDPGQRDTYYDHAYVKYADSSALPSLNRVVVVFDYFRHTGLGPLNVNSYPLPYIEIPAYTSATNLEFQLRNSLDYRPRRVDDSATMAFESVQFSNESGTETDISYYMSRIDKIVITNDKTFKVLRGISSYYSPMPPIDIGDAMTIAIVSLPPYTHDVSVIPVKLINNRRYTMRDIGRLDQRITNVEIYTNLNTLENKVLNKTFYDPSSVELFKSGFLTDGFDNFSNGNTNSPEYRCSIDTTTGVARPMFVMDSVKLDMDTVLSTARKTTTLVTMPYTEMLHVSNRVATSVININPFNVVGNIGVATISPSSDYWFDTKALPVINVVNSDTLSFIKAQSQAAAFNASSTWGAWKTIWQGQPISTNAGVFVNTKSQSTRIENSVSESSAVTLDNTVVISKEQQPYTRTNNISFVVDGMNPNIKLYAWIDSVMVNNYITPNLPHLQNTVIGITLVNGGSGYVMGSTTVTINGGNSDATAEVTGIVNGVITGLRITNIGSGYMSNPTVTITGAGTGATATASITVATKGTPITTDSNGHVTGVLSFPNDTVVRFPTGKHRILFSESNIFASIGNAFADALYTAEGYINTTQRTIVTTKTPLIVSTTQSKNIDSVVWLARYYDPLAQSFLIDGSENPAGVFVSSFNFFFSSKDPVMPVMVELRPMVNGYPSSSVIIPSSVIVKYPADINTSANATVPTKFTFTDPIYLQPGEYCVVLKSGSNKFNVFISEMNKVQIGTNQVVSKQPHLGSLFESQNASTWTAEQLKDLCFDLNICEFSIGSTNLVLKNELRDEDVTIDMYSLTAQNLQPENTTLSAAIQLPGGYANNITIGQDTNVESPIKIKLAGDAVVTMTLTNTNKFISPVVDLERTALVAINNIVNNKTDVGLIPETDNRLGSALGKYVMNTVTLNQGFSANSLNVIIGVNRPAGSSVQVYARMKNEYDVSKLDTRPWILLNQEINGGNTSTVNEFVEDTWSIYDYSYSGFIDFHQFEVKVVFWSPNSSKVPVIADIRAVALI